MIREKVLDWNVKEFSKASYSNVAEIWDFNGLEIVERMDGDRPYPTILILEEEQRTCKPWRKPLIIKLLGRGIGFKALESKLFQL